MKGFKVIVFKGKKFRGCGTFGCFKTRKEAKNWAIEVKSDMLNYTKEEYHYRIKRTGSQLY